jgi:hypothetical protein
MEWEGLSLKTKPKRSLKAILIMARPQVPESNNDRLTDKIEPSWK